MSGQIDSSGWTERELDALAETLLNKFMARTLESIGYDVSTAESRASIREDHQWVREWRIGASKARNAAVGAGITSFVGGLLYLIYMAIKQAMKGN